MRETIYVPLRDEGTDCWAPVEADHVRDEIYRIVTSPGSDCLAEFGPGTLVRCRLRQTEDRTYLVAFIAADQPEQ